METFPTTLCLCFKTSPRVNYFQFIEFDLHENISGAQFQMNGCTVRSRFVLTQRQWATRECLVKLTESSFFSASKDV